MMKGKYDLQVCWYVDGDQNSQSLCWSLSHLNKYMCPRYNCEVVTVTIKLIRSVNYEDCGTVQA